MSEPLDRAALDDLLAMAGDDSELYVELLDSFLVDAAQYAAELDAAVVAAEGGALLRPAHSLKSNAMNVGATRLAELSRALEVDARTGEVPDAAGRVASLRAELDLVREAVAGELRRVSGGA